MATDTRRREPTEAALSSCRAPDVEHDTTPAIIPAPGEALCAVSSATVRTAANTDALHAATADVLDGIKKESVAVNTTVVGGTDEEEGLEEGVNEALPEADELELPLALALLDSRGVTLPETDASSNRRIVDRSSASCSVERTSSGKAPKPSDENRV